MAIDLEKMRQKLQSLESKGGNNYLKLQDGKTTVRILPTEDGDPFKDFHFHYNLQERGGALCPKRNFGEACPVCEFVSNLYQAGDDESKQMASKMVAKQRFFSPVIVRGEEKDGPKVWSYSKTVYQELLNTVLDPDFGDITDVDEGRDVLIEYGKEGGKSFPTTNLRIRPKQTKAAPKGMSDEEFTGLLEKIPDFGGLHKRLSTSDMQGLLDTKMAELSGDDDGSPEVSKGGNVTDLDTALEELAS